MVDFLILIELLLMLAVSVLLIMWFVFLILKKKHKPIGIAVLICIAAFFVVGIGTGTLLEQEEKESVVLNEEAIREIPPENEVTTTTKEKEVVTAPETEPGDSRTNPIVVTVSQFANEINSNTDTTKTKYNGKWVQITGKVLSAHNVAGMTSFYLHGEKGGSGLRIVCWVNKEVLKPFDYRGETHTFIGQVREVSTANSTEIGNCEIIE